MLEFQLISWLLGRKVSKVLLSFLMSCYKLNDFENLSDAIKEQA